MNGDEGSRKSIIANYSRIPLAALLSFKLDRLMLVLWVPGETALLASLVIITL